jgi:putative RecB family exonuclease
MATLDEYRKRPHWSYSALNQFVNICSLQFAFERVYRIRRVFTPVTLAFGSAFHRCCEWVNLVRQEGGRPDRKDAADLFQTLWQRQLDEDRDIRFDEDQSAECCAAQGRDMMACLVASLDPDEEVLAVNESFAVPLVDAEGCVLETPMIGEIDAVVRSRGQKRLVDVKTSGRRWPRGKADLELQPTVFLYGYHQVHGELPGFRFDVVVKNKTPVFESHETRRDADSFLRLVEIAKRVESMIRHEHFLPNEQSFYCGSCPFQEACRAWHRNRAAARVRMAA